MRYAIILFTLAFANCTSQSPQDIEVAHHGALKIMMHEGDISAKAGLKELADQDHVYALGALENLKGEILILDSEPLISMVDENELKIDDSFEYRAALLVNTAISRWNEFELPETVTSAEGMEHFIEKMAQANGIDTAKPFPFLIEGVAESFDWHVINWPEGDTEHSHVKHVNSGLNGTETNTEVTILGFYSRHHHRIFTHHSTNVHMHVKSPNVTGHVDGLTLGRGMTLKLPR